MELKKNIQKRLKEQRKTQVDLCKDLGVTSQSLQYYFRGNITLSKLSEIAAALNCQPWELIRPADEDPTTDSPRQDQEHSDQEHHDTTTPREATRPAILCPNCGKLIYLNPTTKEDDPRTK